MRYLYSDKFIEALKANDMDKLEAIPKSDLHNHFTLSGSRECIILGRVKRLEKHPIKELYRSGGDVTINSDDILIFDSDISKEYIRLYNAETSTAEELDDIRINGLRRL